MARTTLASLINTLRGMTYVGTADYTLGTLTYWDNDQMQPVLDRHRVDITRFELESVSKHVGGGTIEWYDYYAAHKHLETTDAGTAIFIVENSTGTDQGTALWSADYARGIVSFVADQGGSSRFLTARSYDLNAAAADIWRHKAGYFAEFTDFTSDDHRVSMSQKSKHCVEMAEHYESQTDAQTVEMFPE